MNRSAKLRAQRVVAFLGRLAVVVLLATAGARAADAPREAAATVDLTTDAGAQAVQATWRYSDARIVDTVFRTPDAHGQPTGAPLATHDIVPHAGATDFDDSAWPTIAPSSLREPRGTGRVSFNWYRLSFTIPARIGEFDPTGAALWFETRVDDYAEIWVDGELGRAYGQEGGSVVAGWNAQNRVLVRHRVRPGQKVELAIFGVNGPISDSPTNYIFLHEARLRFFSPGDQAPIAVAPHEVNIRVERDDPAVDAIVPPNAKLFKVAEGFLFTEGPVWVRSGGYLLFSDPNNNTIYRYDDASGLAVFREKSGYDAADIAEYLQPGSNGLTLDRQGRLTIDEQGRHRVSRLESDGRLTVLAAAYHGKRLNSPNDLVYRSDGALYFTDPPFGLPKFFDDPRKELPFSGVYLWKNGDLRLLTQEFKGPNGIAFTPDEKYLYVDNWDPAVKQIKRYPVHRDGTLGPGELFADLTESLPGEEALDGMKVDVQGHLYVSAQGAVWIFDASGKHLGTLFAPTPVHNFAWGGVDGRTLYLCARANLYRIPLLVEGVRP